MAKKQVTLAPGTYKLIGTGPLSFDVKVGTVLTIRELGANPPGRPTVGGKFKQAGYIVFNGITKVGRLAPTDVAGLAAAVPAKCRVHEVDSDRQLLVVRLVP